MLNPWPSNPAGTAPEKPQRLCTYRCRTDRRTQKGTALRNSTSARNHVTYTAVRVPAPTHSPRSGGTDIVELIRADHARIRRLLAVFDSAARWQDPTRALRMVTEAWDRAADLLGLHCDAEEEICYPALFATTAGNAAVIGDATADHDDIRMAIDETRMHGAGSPPWWRAVTGAASICDSHFSWEEKDVLPEIQRRISPAQGRVLGQQWTAYIYAQKRDAADRQVASRRPSRSIERW